MNEENVPSIFCIIFIATVLIVVAAVVSIDLQFPRRNIEVIPLFDAKGANVAKQSNLRNQQHKCTLVMHLMTVVL